MKKRLDLKYLTYHKWVWMLASINLTLQYFKVCLDDLIFSLLLCCRTNYWTAQCMLLFIRFPTFIIFKQLIRSKIIPTYTIITDYFSSYNPCCPSYIWDEVQLRLVRSSEFLVSSQRELEATGVVIVPVDEPTGPMHSTQPCRPTYHYSLIISRFSSCKLQWYCTTFTSHRCNSSKKKY